MFLPPPEYPERPQEVRGVDGSRMPSFTKGKTMLMKPEA